MQGEYIIFPEGKCPKCRGVLSFCQLVTRNGNRHLKAWCAPCYRLWNKSITQEQQTRYKINIDQVPLYLTRADRNKAARQNQVTFKVKPAAQITPVGVRSQPAPVDMATVKELQAMPYAKYLKTAHWKKIRAEAVCRALFRCQLCNSPDSLSAHYRTYERRGHERPKDLTVLCNACHSKFHNISPKAEGIGK